MQARAYLPEIGRFLQEDHYEQALGDQALETDPLTQDRYAFAGGNPLSNIEFDGHRSCGATCRPGEHQQNYGGRVQKIPGERDESAVDFTGSTRKADFEAAERASRAETVPALAVRIAGSPGERVLGGDLRVSELARFNQDTLRYLYAQVAAEERRMRIVATAGPDWAGVVFGDSPLEVAINIIPIGRGANLGRRLGTGLFRAVKGADRAKDPAKAAAKGGDLLKPGRWAKESVPSSGPGKITQAERDALNPIGEKFGCHSCGARSPGTKSGNWIGDHQPVSRTVPPGTPQRLFPHCQACSNEQGLWIINLLRSGGL